MCFTSGEATAIIVIMTIVIMMYYYKEQFRPYMLSNGLMANTPLEAVIDAEYNGNAYLKPTYLLPHRPYVLKGVGCAAIPTDSLLYEAMGIPESTKNVTEQHTAINKIGYMYKM